MEWSRRRDRRGRGKGDLLTVTSTNSKRSSRRLPGMRGSREKRTESREQKERREGGKAEKGRKRNPCGVLSLTPAVLPATPPSQTDATLSQKHR